MKKLLFLMLLVTLSSMAVQAVDSGNNGAGTRALGYFTMPEIEVEPGETFVLPVSFTCENSVYALAFGVSIPEGFEVVSVKQANRVTGTFQYATPAGAVNVVIYDLTGGAAIDRNDGVIVNITLKATENLSGDYTFTISQGNYGIVGMTGNPQYPENISTTVHVGTQIVVGDVNGDNKVNIADVTYLINYLLSQGSTGAYMESADVNHDNKVNIADVTYLINYLISHK